MNCFGYGDLVYLLSNNNRTQEKFDIFIHPIIKSGEQGIIFSPHLSTIYYEVKKLKQMDISCAAYTSNVDYNRRDRIRDSFEDGNIQFLYATPNMYFMNKCFRDFVNYQALGGNLSSVVIDEAKYLFEYGNETDNYESYENISELKDVAPLQRWVVIADAECENNLGDIADMLHLENAMAIKIRYNRKGAYHKYLFNL